MIRVFSGFCLILAAIMHTGCAAGPYGGAGNCHCGACEGVGGPQVPHAPFQQWRKSLICGNGCGEIYYGDYINNPPDCCDPCDNTVQCTPPIQARPGLLVLSAVTGLYGKRVPRDAACACGSCDICVGSYETTTYDSGCDCGGYSAAGCSTCASTGGYVGSGYATSPGSEAYVIDHGSSQQVIAGRNSGSRSSNPAPNRPAANSRTIRR